MFERPIVIGQRLRWRYADSNEPSEDAEVVNVRTDLEEGCSPEVMDYVALWIEAKYVQDSPKAKPFTILLCTDKLPYIEGKEIARYGAIARPLRSVGPDNPDSHAASTDRLFVAAPACNQYNFLMEETAQDDGLGAFFAVRPRLFGIAYRMLGSAAEAEDLVQDVWIRWQSADRKAVQDPPAYLATITTRLAINVVKSARSRREEYFGIWLPEPVDTSADPGLGAQRSQALEFAVLLLLERLAPNERAAYILREAFDYAYDEIGEILKVSEANARQMVTRARKHITEGRRRPVEAVEQRRLLDKFIAAAQKGELAALEALFASDVVSYSDGGGLVRAAGKPISGRERVARFISTFATHFWKGVTVSVVEANGQRCALVSRDGTVVALVTVGASEEGIDQIMWMLRPSKLAGVLTPLT